MKWTRASEHSYPLEIYLQVKDNIGMKRMGNFYIDDDGLHYFSVDRTGSYESYIIEEKHFDKLYWLDESPESSVWPGEEEIEKVIDENCGKKEDEDAAIPAFYFRMGLEWLKEWLQSRTAVKAESRYDSPNYKGGAQRTPIIPSQPTAGGVKEEGWDDKTQLYGLLQIIKDDPCYLHLDGRIQKTIESIGNHVVKKYEMGKDSQIPRRIRLDLSEPAELAIRNAVDEVEKIGADVRLTNAINLLNEARELVADYIDKVPLKSQPSLSNPSIKRPTEEEIKKALSNWILESVHPSDGPASAIAWREAINWLLSIQSSK